jgi:phenylalanyl-tRNA synthetase beta chain
LAVDITNYIMLELGQPLHAFDQDKLSGEIQIRYAKSGEVLETLDHVKRTMDSNDLLVADNSRALSIAGIMGGLDSEVTENTKNIVIEAAHFAAQKVAETARRHILTSEASRRFERGVDPQLPIAASNLAVKYLVEFAGAEVVGRSTNSTDLPSAVIDLDLEKLHVIGGIEFTYEDVKRKLESIGCEVDSKSNIKVIAPSWRPDLLTQNDLAEEILRLTGYDQIPMVLPKAPAGSGFTKIQRYDRQLRQVLAAQGLSEILNYPFVGLVDSQFVANVKIGKEDLVFIANPLSDEKPFLRRSLLPGMFEAVSRNIGRGSLDLSLFEIGSIFKPSAASSSSFNDISSPPSMQQLRNLDNLIPVQSRSLVVFGSGKNVSDSPIVESHNWNWYEIIGLASSLFDLLHIPFESSAAEMAPWHPGRCAQFKIGDLVVGHAGELHPKAIEHFNLPTKSVALEINLDLLLEHATEVIQAKPIHTMPIAKEDLAVVVAGDIPVSNILHLVKKAAGDVLEQAEIFDVYAGNQVPAGQKSVAVSLRFRASDRTLTSEEVAGYKEAILQELAKSIGAKIRE